MKNFRESKKMTGACVVTGTVVLIVGGLVVGSIMGATAITADVLQIAILTFGGGFSAAWAAALGMQGWHDVRHGPSLPKLKPVVTPSSSPTEVAQAESEVVEPDK